MDCGVLNLWLESDPSGLGVTWQGRPAWDFADMRSHIGLKYDVITDLPEPENNLYSDMLALMKGVGDISIDYWGVNYERSKLIEFSYPASYAGIYIFSGHTGGFMHADLVMAVFDKPSMVLLLFALVSMVVVLWLHLMREDNKNILLNCFLYVFGNALKQPLSRSIIPNTLLGQILMMVVSMYNYIICLMYGSVIISLLIGGSRPPEIYSFEDLNKEGNKHMRIILEKRSPFPSLLKSANMLDGFEQRIDYIDTYKNLNNKQDIYNKLLEGSHVRITTSGTFSQQLCQTLNFNDDQLAKFKNYMKSRQVLK